MDMHALVRKVAPTWFSSTSHISLEACEEFEVKSDKSEEKTDEDQYANYDLENIIED